jgi:hypothetical protein
VEAAEAVIARVRVDVHLELRQGLTFRVELDVVVGNAVPTLIDRVDDELLPLLETVGREALGQ